MPTALPVPGAPAQDLGELAVAFQSFNRSSRRLEDAYRLLQQRLLHLDGELIEANQRLARKVEELNSLTTYLNEILASLHNGVVAVDREGRVTALNQAAERILGLPAAEAVGRTHQSILCDGDGTPSPLAAALASGGAIRGFEREVASAQGKCLRLRSTVAPIHNSRGELVGAVEVFSDLTEFRELQERLDRADKLAALGQMAAQLAHEIRNPLNGIEGFAGLLLRDLDAGDKRRQFARHILAGARSLNKIVTNMLDFAQPCRPQPRLTSLEAILDEALAFIAEECRQLGRTDVAVRREFDPAAESLVADPDLLRQAVMNLLLNAVQAMPGGGQVRVVTRALPGDPERVEIRIEDSGPGIPAEVRDRVLEPFFTTKSRGTGLGLAIVQKIARVHGGQLDLQSEEGHGTAAILTLPRREGESGNRDA